MLRHAKVGAVAAIVNGQILHILHEVFDARKAVFAEREEVAARIAAAALYTVPNLCIPITGDGEGHGVCHRRDAPGKVVAITVLIHGVHGLVALFVPALALAVFKSGDVVQPVERAAGAEEAIVKAAENVRILHCATLGEQENIGSHPIAEGADKNVLILAVAGGDGIVGVVGKTNVGAVFLAVEHAVFVPRKANRRTVISQVSRHEGVFGLRRAAVPLFCAGLHMQFFAALARACE